MPGVTAIQEGAHEGVRRQDPLCAPATGQRAVQRKDGQPNQADQQGKNDEKGLHIHKSL